MIPTTHRTRILHSMALEDSDSALILETLEKASWIVGGPRGIAAKLGLKRIMLLAKKRRLGVPPEVAARIAEDSGEDPLSVREFDVLRFIRDGSGILFDIDVLKKTESALQMREH